MTDDFSLERPRRRWLLGLVLIILMGWWWRAAWLPPFLDWSLNTLAPLSRFSQQFGEAMPWRGPSVSAQEYERLILQNRVYKRQIQAMDVIVAENQSLRQALALKMPQGYRKVTAQVVLRAPTHWHESLQIDHSFSHSVEPKGLLNKKTRLNFKRVKFIDALSINARLNEGKHDGYASGFFSFVVQI